MSFSGLMLAIGTLTAFLTFVTLWLVPRDEKWSSKVTRDRIVGIVFMVVCLSAVWYQMDIMCQDNNWLMLQKLLRFAVPVAILGSFVYLDFLLTRAFGGIMLLLTAMVCSTSFSAAVPLPWRGILGIFSYALGIWAIFAVVCPWRIRNMLEACHKSKVWRFLIGGCFAVLTVVYAVFAATFAS